MAVFSREPRRLDGFTGWMAPTRRTDPGFLRGFREKAMVRFRERGLPTSKQEGFRFSNLAGLYREQFSPEPEARLYRLAIEEAQTLREEFGPCHTIVFINGQLELSLSSALAPRQAHTYPFRIGALGSLAYKFGFLIQEHMEESLAERGDAFASLNSAIAREGMILHIPSGVTIDQPILCLYVHVSEDAAPAFHYRNLIVAGASSQATVIERYYGTHGRGLTNSVTQIIASTASRLDHYHLGFESPDWYSLATTAIAQSKRSTVNHFPVLMGSKFSRHSAVHLLNGESAQGNIHGLYLADGTREVDVSMRCEHRAPDCTSRQSYRGIARDRARAVFEGMIHVAPVAQKTDARQKCANLVLSDLARVHANPQLEIHADDVKCSHGATIGQLDEGPLNYLRCRGIAEPVARALLTHAFAAEVTDPMAQAEVRESITHELINRLREPDALRGLLLGQLPQLQ